MYILTTERTKTNKRRYNSIRIFIGTVVILTITVLVCSVVFVLSKQKNDSKPKEKESLKDARVVGGVVVEKNEFPATAFLRISMNNQRFQCGATIISDLFVVTAAHCILPLNKPVTVDQLKIGYGSPNVDKMQWVGVSAVFIHPDFDKIKIVNDIALLKVDKAFEFSDNVKRAKIDLIKVENNDVVTAVGWGIKNNNETNGSDVLNKVDLMVKDPKICEPARANFANNNEDYICIANGEKGKDTCYGDSGGPVYSRSQDEKYNLLLGLTSYGETASNKKSDIYRPLCAVSDTFGFYTRVGYYIDFIAALTNNKRDYYTIDQTKSTRGILNKYNSAESAIIIM